MERMKRAPLAKRFEAKVVKGARPNDCWEWVGSKNPRGYGKIGTGVGKSTDYAHRVSWSLFRGPIPPGAVICHSCDRPACVNPNHLILGSQADNVHDCIEKGRFIRGEAVGGAKLTADAVREIRAAYAAGLGDAQTLARAYGVTRRNIAAILERRSWAHVA